MKNNSYHLHIARAYWKLFINKKKCVIDATCGNGKDTLYLAQLLLPKNPHATLYAIDIQKQAITNTKKLLSTHLPSAYLSQIVLSHQSHKTFPLLSHRADLIVYNLGYLPGSDKTLTTTAYTTIESLKYAQNILNDNGAISITCYPGHPQGREEKEVLLTYLSTLGSAWSIYHHIWPTHLFSPSLIWITKANYC